MIIIEFDDDKESIQKELKKYTENYGPAPIIFKALKDAEDNKGFTKDEIKKLAKAMEFIEPEYKDLHFFKQQLETLIKQF